MKIFRTVLFAVIYVFLAPAASAQPAAGGQGGLTSPIAAGIFGDIGYGLYTGEGADFDDAKKATVFFNAAVELNSRADYVLDDIIKIAWRWPDEKFSDAVLQAMYQYIDRKVDLDTASKGVGFLLEQRSSREKREELLTKLNYEFSEKNPLFGSELTAQLGFLKAETADYNDAYNYLIQSFSVNPFSRLAFAKLQEAVAAMGAQLPETVYIQHFRCNMRSNPLDFDSAVSFAQYCDSIGAYSPAAAGYRYCVDLYNYLNKSKSFAAFLYRPWMLSCYNAADYKKCAGILETVRSKNEFDIYIEALAAAAAEKNGDEKKAHSILSKLRRRSDEILNGSIKADSDTLIDYAWFYSFASDSNEALTWATKAYDAEPNSTDAVSLFAYALVRSGSDDLASAMVEKLDIDTQTAALARAEITAADGNSTKAVETLKALIDAAPGTFEAKKAKEMLENLGGQYEPPVDIVEFEKSLKNDFGNSFVSEFIRPEQMVSVELKTNGSAFSYGNDITANLIITNNYSEPLIIGPDCLLKGQIRIDVKLGADAVADIERFIERTVRPSYEIAPGEAYILEFELNRGRLRRILSTRPQGQINIEFTAYLDPQTSADGAAVKNSLGIGPAKAVVNRRPVEVDKKYLQQKLAALDSSHQGRKADAAGLFAGLIAEQQLFRKTEPVYRFIYVRPELLSDVLARALADDDWVLRVRAMAEMEYVKLDYGLTEAISQQLESPYWPVRLMALYILDKNQDKRFSEPLKWMSQNDPSAAVQQFATLLLKDRALRYENTENKN